MQSAPEQAGASQVNQVVLNADKQNSGGHLVISPSSGQGYYNGGLTGKFGNYFVLFYFIGWVSGNIFTLQSSYHCDATVSLYLMPYFLMKRYK